jgi:hypothetical protein
MRRCLDFGAFCRERAVPARHLRSGGFHRPSLSPRQIYVKYLNMLAYLTQSETASPPDAFVLILI